jgi:hypothetical protein
MVFWPIHSLLVWIERIWKFFEFGLLLTKEGEDFAHLALYENAQNETKRYRRRSAMKISVVGKGAEWKQALSPKAPNELNLALPWLLMGQIQKTSR